MCPRGKNVLIHPSCILLSQLRFYYAKLLDTPEEVSQVLGFVNSAVDSHDEDDDIIEAESSFSGNF